jgi:hypothetical protein
MTVMYSHHSFYSPESHAIEIHLQASLFGSFWECFGLFTGIYKLSSICSANGILFSFLNTIFAYVF